MTPLEKIIEFLRDHPDSTREQISKGLGHERNWACRWLKVLRLNGKVAQRKINVSEYRYTLIDDAIKNIKDDNRFNSAIRSLMKFEKFKKDVIPLIEQIPGRTAKFYAEIIGHGISSTARRLDAMKKMGLLFSDRRRRKGMKQKTALWWIKGTEPKDLDAVEVQEENVCNYARRVIEVKKITDDEAWLREISKSRQQRIMERLQAENNPMPIPSYDEFFKANKL